MSLTHPLGPALTPSEYHALAHLREHLPDAYTLFHGFDILRGTTPSFVSLAILAPHALYLVDVKPTRGVIDVYGPKWYPQGAQPFTSPLFKLHSLTQALTGTLTASYPGRRELERVYVAPVVLLVAPDAYLTDHGTRDAEQVTTLHKSAAFFQDPTRIPARFDKNITRLHAMVRAAFLSVARERPTSLALGFWKIVEYLGAADAFTEYRAIHDFAGKGGTTDLLRVYETDPTLAPEQQDEQRRLITNAFEALSRLPGNPFVAAPKGFFPTSDAQRYVLVTEDVSGQALRLHIDKPALALTLDQKLRIARELLEALAFCHQYQVIHRNLSPSTIMLGSDGHVHLISFDHARAGFDRTHTIADQIIDELDPHYVAPEVRKNPADASPASDVFGAGLVLFELFTGQRPFASPTELFEQSAIFSTKPSANRAELAPALDDWLQRLCAFDPGQRPSARQAADELQLIVESPADHIDGAEFINRALALTSGELRPLLDLVRGLETDVLEFKEALHPTKEFADSNLADVQWAITRTVAAMANTAGGVILVGVNDDAKPVGLAPSDPKQRLQETNGWDDFVRAEVNGALYREGGWATAKKGTWRLDIKRLQMLVTVRRATLDGVDVLALIVRPTGGSELLLATNTKHKTPPSTWLFTRASGDKGEVQSFDKPDHHERWARERRVRSPAFIPLLARLRALNAPPVKSHDEVAIALEWADLPRGTLLHGKLEVQERLGSGNFGVVYKVVDTLGDVTRALKLILHDRDSTIERLKKEYKTLVHMPEHPHVVRVIDANVLPGAGPPYILFEHVNGEDLGNLIEDGRFAPEDALTLFRQVAEGLVHLHRAGVQHCDIKPHNVLWTVRGATIIDFNVAVRSEDDGHGGGSRRYLPPDLDLSVWPSPSEREDRDVYALGLTVYEALTGKYPWQSTSPPPATPVPDPRERPGLSDLAPDFVSVLLRTVAPKRSDRFVSASALLEALTPVSRARREPTPETSDSFLVQELGAAAAPNTNPFVGYLTTLYSQSPKTNAGTRGLDALGRRTYVPTLLDDALIPAVLAGKFKLVLITGNAGDGKTAFLQQFEAKAGDEAELVSSEPLTNGRRFTTGHRTFLTNYDGSQDEDARGNAEVLREFFSPFAGDDPNAWPSAEIRLIAINEGRLVDFLQTERAQFPALLRLVEEGLRTGEDAHGVAVVNLNLRSVVSSREHGHDDSILERQVRLLTRPTFWQACQGCDLKDKCYALHNAQTFQDPTAGPRVLERLKTLYTLTHLRGRLHVTLRDLRSALAFMLTSARDCEQIHALYTSHRREEIAASFYFNAWMGAESATVDRLLVLLRGVDVGTASDPRMDRALDFVSPDQDRSRFGFAARGAFDHDVLRAIHDDLPRDFSGKPASHRAAAHRRYVAMARRRAFFERRDDAWREMLPYRSAGRMLKLVHGELPTTQVLPELLQAINRGEGLHDPARLRGSLALQVRQVDRGTIRSYRLYDGSRFQLSVRDGASRARFVEHMPDGLVLRYDGERTEAELVIDLDVFEMLDRLSYGYRPSIEEQQGYYLSLVVFKNVLGSAPYQEVLLTTTGHDFYRVQRHDDGRLELTHLPAAARREVSAGGVHSERAEVG